MAETKMIAVRWKRGCSRIMAASSKPSSSGMQTSISMTASFVLEQEFQRLAGGARLDQVLAELAQDHLVGQQLRRLIVDQQDVDLVVCSPNVLHGEPQRCSHIRSAESSCSVLTGLAR